MTTYPETKDSGVEWIGEIPSHWSVSPLKFVTKISYGDSLKSEDRNEEGSISVYGSNGIVGQHNESLTHGPTIIIGRKGSHGKLNFSEESCYPIDTTFFIDRSLTHQNLRWLYRTLSCLGLDKWSKDSAVPGINREEIYERRIPTPPLSEQKTIVSFLDLKTSLIDKIIENKTQRIELLKQMRSSLISEVVTKGLNPDVPMKDSGVEWIGKIPSHWKTVRMKYLLQDQDGLQTGPFGGMITPDKMTSNGVKVFGQVNVLQKDFSLGHRYVSDEEFDSSLSRYEIVSGDLVLTRKGSLGQISQVPNNIPKGILDSDLIRLRPLPSIVHPKFLVRVVSDSDYVSSQVTQYTRGSVVGGVNSEVVGGVTIVIPPLSEQTEILQLLNDKQELINDELTRESRSIEHLREFRQSLIHEVVTGKMDVRGVLTS